VIRRVAFAAAVLLCVSAPARAQIPAPPPETTPVLEVIAPTVSPVCGNALLVAVLAPGLVAGETGGALPVDPSPALAPLYVVCGAVPGPPARLSCDADHSLNETANAAAGAVAGTPLPVGVDPVGNEVEQLVVIQDKLPPPANATGALDQVVATLNCKAVASVTAPPAPAASEGDEPVDDSVLGEEFALAPLLDTLAPGIATIAPPPSGDDVIPIAPATTTVAGVGFLYPVVFALPLVLLVLGGYLGRSLTQPVAPPQR
jgi:hypothetical protein